jgi:DNA-binding NarL/FixJ family response regulator
VFGVLIVDDSRLFLQAARVLLEREGLRVVGVAVTAAQALRRAAELRPEVVLVDIMLGGESGFDLARRLSGHDRGGGAAVILISTYAEADFADLIAESPATGFLSKGELSARAIRRVADGGGPAGPSALARAETRRPARLARWPGGWRHCRGGRAGPTVWPMPRNAG